MYIHINGHGSFLINGFPFLVVASYQSVSMLVLRVVRGAEYKRTIIRFNKKLVYGGLFFSSDIGRTQHKGPTNSHCHKLIRPLGSEDHGTQQEEAVNESRGFFL